MPKARPTSDRVGAIVDPGETLHGKTIGGQEPSMTLRTITLSKHAREHRARFLP